MTFRHVPVIFYIPMTSLSHAPSRPVWAANERMRSLRLKRGSSEETSGSAFRTRSSHVRRDSGVEPPLPGWCRCEQIESNLIRMPLRLPMSSGKESLVRFLSWTSWSRCRRSRRLEKCVQKNLEALLDSFSDVY